MRILLLGDIRPTHLKRWRDYFLERGHTVRTVSLQDDPDDSDHISIDSAVPVEAFKYYFEKKAVSRIIRDFQPDIVNGHFVTTYGTLGVASDFHPLVVSMWGSDILVSPKKSKLHLARVLWVLRNCDLLTSDSDYLTDQARRLGKFKTRIVTEPMGIPDEQFALLSEPIKSDGSGIRTILSTRRLEPLYRVDMLIEALARADDRLPSFSCIIAGDGSERERLQALVKEHDLDSIAFVGWKGGRDYIDLLRRADIYVSCSESDSTSVSLLEAMAAGTIPVVTDIPGNREWVKNEKTALTFPVGDVEALTQAILRAVTDDRLAVKAAARNVKAVESRAIWQKNMASIERAFEELVRKQR